MAFGTPTMSADHRQHRKGSPPAATSRFHLVRSHAEMAQRWRFTGYSGAVSTAQKAPAAAPTDATFEKTHAHLSRDADERPCVRGCRRSTLDRCGALCSLSRDHAPARCKWTL